MQATYVSVWDGSTEIRTSCEIDMAVNPPLVTNVEEVDDTGNINSLDKEYIELPDGTQVLTYQIDEDGEYYVEDGSRVYEEY